MSVYIAGQLMQSIDALSPKATIILQFISGGNGWLNRLISNPDNKLNLDNDNHLIRVAQEGLHNASQIYIGSLDLFVGIDRLFQIGLQQLQSILDYSKAPGDDRKLINDVLEENKLLTCSTLLAAKKNAIKKGITNNGLIDASTQAEQILLYKLVNSGELTNHNKITLSKACEFSARRAQNATGYIFLIKIYLKLYGADKVNNNSNSEMKSIESSVDKLLPLIENTLTSPSVSHAPGQDGLSDTINQWQNSGHQLGFTSLYAGVYQLVKNLQTSGINEQGLQTTSLGYIKAAQQFIGSNKSYDAELSQSGNLWTYFFEDDGGQGNVICSSSGCISLASYSPNVHPSKSIQS